MPSGAPKSFHSEIPCIQNSDVNDYSHARKITPLFPACQDLIFGKPRRPTKSRVHPSQYSSFPPYSPKSRWPRSPEVAPSSLPSAGGRAVGTHLQSNRLLALPPPPATRWKSLHHSPYL